MHLMPPYVYDHCTTDAALPKGGDALPLLGSKGIYGSCVGGW